MNRKLTSLSSLFSPICKFIRGSKNALIFSFFMIITAFISGLILPAELREKILEWMFSYLSEVNFSVGGILLNNIISGFIMVFGGVFLSIPTIANGFVNFLVLGAAFSTYADTSGVINFLIMILPHGIFEIPAILISIALGVRIGANLVHIRALGGNLSFFETLKNSFIVFLLLVLPMLLIAAAVEVYITPYLIRLAGISLNL